MRLSRKLLLPSQASFRQKKSQVILAGDPKQLGAIIQSPLAKKHGLDISLLERLMQNTTGTMSSRYTKLLTNYRSHKDILKPPNELFYDSELKAGASIDREKLCHWDGLPKKGFPVIFHSVVGKDQQEENSPSYFNPEEANMVLKYITNLMQTRSRGINLNQNEIGVITPYWRQVKKIQTLLRKKHYDGIKVGTVEEFQGQERTVIIVSTVRSNPEYMTKDAKFNLGFLRNPKRFNVTVTRPKALLVVIGNPHILSNDYHWGWFIKYCKEMGGLTGEKFVEADKDMYLIQQLEALKINTAMGNDTPKEVSRHSELYSRKDE